MARYDIGLASLHCAIILIMAKSPRKLNPEDQAKVDQYLNEGYNNVERREFRPGVLFIVLFGVLLVFSAAAYLIARSAGVV